MSAHYLMINAHGACLALDALLASYFQSRCRLASTDLSRPGEPFRAIVQLVTDE